MQANGVHLPSLEGKVAIVTGGSRGLGFGFALDLARRGAKVAAVYTSAGSSPAIDDLIAQARSLCRPSECIGIRADLRDPSSASAIVAQTLSAFGSDIDIVVNNAGAEIVAPFWELTGDDFQYVYSLNVVAPMLLLQACLPHLATSGARIINIGSVGAREGFANLSLYCSSKAALEGMTRCWAAELGSGGHTVNCVNPGPVQSEMLDNIPQEIVARQKSMTPMGNRLGTVEDVASIVGWLASEESRWVTGQTISASGGLNMY